MHHLGGLLPAGQGPHEDGELVAADIASYLDHSLDVLSLIRSERLVRYRRETPLRTPRRFATTSVRAWQRRRIGHRRGAGDQIR